MIYDLSAIWAAVKETFPYFDRVPFDWDEQYHTYLAKMLQVTEEADFHRLLTELMESLNDGHTKYIPPAEFRVTKSYSRPAAPSFTIDDGILTIEPNEFLMNHADYVFGKD